MGTPGPGLPTFAETTELVVSTLGRELPGSVIWIGHLDSDRDTLRVVAAGGDASIGVEAGMETPLRTTFCHLLATGDGAALANHVPTDPAYGALPIAAGLDVGSFAGVPLTLHDGRAVGTLCAVTRRRGAYSDRELNLLHAFAVLLARDIEHQFRDADLAQVVEDLRRQASIDPLTGVCNRRAFHAALDRVWARHRTSASVAVVDVDAFKAINDRHGHAMGDRVLAGIAAAMAGAAGRRDRVGRLGGDEFAIVLAGDDPAEWQLRFDSRVRSLALELGVSVTASSGYAALAAAETTDAALVAADEALYARKRGLAALTA